MAILCDNMGYINLLIAI